ncbi:methyltransferase domain-containing protein [Desulfovibrio sulfodismutans]|uniref:Methyltransferase domain-containing protein n=1 Tax=Desulfolutivibrio sulfodismutans TaxID=63561 RepID=A0A7K3NIU8_9BACT|nr:class I SAM-dependent methyltransferase [Desulfolutivibrio sulfodismutans]NDY56126.1 methyltransferase domain-containing protein [Desulfolutivibrio sulfodismutans]QLA13179.1 methyltransferase domain-containing protein [Desulfolutivibrio sulfodismutans DSM 3696]
MKTEWDYTVLANAYVERPDYAPEALEQLFAIAGLRAGDLACDVGAGAGHLTIPMAKKGLKVIAVEPNDAMRANGQKRTTQFANVSWVDATGEDTRQLTGIFDFVSFGSSFNVMDRAVAMKETYRLLKQGKWFTCMWNHRDLDEPIQDHIEAIIKEHISGYDYGSRREDQAAVISASGLFKDVQTVSGIVIHRQNVDKVVEAWRSHGTLHRQAGDAFPAIIQAIDVYLRGLGVAEIAIPYTTRAWIACKA